MFDFLARALCVALCTAVSANAASAQSRASRWEVEGYVGFMASAGVGSGRARTPDPGEPIVTSTPIFPARQTSSWFLGDGATLLNAVNAEFRQPHRIIPLEASLAAIPDPRGGAFGVRVRRRLSDRFSAEFSVNVGARNEGGADLLRTAVESARDSFTAAFGDLLASGPFSRVVVAATSSVTAGAPRRADVAFDVTYRFARWRAADPYIAIGAGVTVGFGSMPSASLQAHYRFFVLDQVPIDETDNLSLRYAGGLAPIAVLGGGIRRHVSDRWGLTIDARLLAGSGAAQVWLDARPSSVRATPAGFVESYTNPAIQFSNDSATGRQTTLSGPAIENFRVFTAGVEARGLVTAGVFVRF